MPRLPTRPALVLLGALLCLAACAPTATVSVPPTATVSVPPTPTTPPTATPTLVPAPTPTNVPSGWLVLSGQHFSLAYPPGWSVQMPETNTGATIYFLAPPPSSHDQGVEVEVFQVPQSVGSEGMPPYCFGPGQDGLKRVLLAGIPMAYQFGIGEGADMRSWNFVNAQRTHYTLDADDAHGTAMVQAQDDRILATFRPDNVTPWQC
jgi:hypothetical protein